MEYQLDSSGNSVINDLATTKDAVYFTDFKQQSNYSCALEVWFYPSKPGSRPTIGAPSE
jgi:hypothetical protein